MNMLIILCVVPLCSTSRLNNIFGDNKGRQTHTTPETTSSLLLSCSAKMRDIFINCSNGAYVEWEQNAISLDLREQLIAKCCGGWQLIQCAVEASKDMCDTDEHGEYVRYFQRLSDGLTANECIDYPAHSERCTTMHISVAPDETSTVTTRANTGLPFGKYKKVWKHRKYVSPDTNVQAKNRRKQMNVTIDRLIIKGLRIGDMKIEKIAIGPIVLGNYRGIKYT